MKCPHPEVAKPETPADRGRPRARANDAHTGRHTLGKCGVESPFVVARIDGQDGRLPSVRGQVRCKNPQPMCRRGAVGREVRADAENSPHHLTASTYSEYGAWTSRSCASRGSCERRKLR